MQIYKYLKKVFKIDTMTINCQDPFEKLNSHLQSLERQ